MHMVRVPQILYHLESNQSNHAESTIKVKNFLKTTIISSILHDKKCKVYDKTYLLNIWIIDIYIVSMINWVYITC